MATATYLAVEKTPVPLRPSCDDNADVTCAADSGSRARWMERRLNCRAVSLYGNFADAQIRYVGLIRQLWLRGRNAQA